MLENSKSNNKIYNNLLSNLDYLLDKGKAYSIYNADEKIFRDFNEEVNQYVKSTNIIISKLEGHYELNLNRPLVIFQDLNKEDFMSRIEHIVNKIIYPVFCKGKSIFFISKMDKMDYNVADIDPWLLHENVELINQQLYVEQINDILEDKNVTITSPEEIKFFYEDDMYTPIEKKFKDMLINKKISFKSQVKLGRYHVDFLIDYRGRKIIVECDGKKYHDKEKDEKRDRELKKEGYKIFRFTGTEIQNNCIECLKEILKFVEKREVAAQKREVIQLHEKWEITEKDIKGPIRVIAPAGSGKTRALIRRIVFLINQGVKEEEILALAFNKKAQMEMKNRLSENFNSNNVNVNTFHSFGYKIIREELGWNFEENNPHKTRVILEHIVSKYGEMKKDKNRLMDANMKMLSKAKNELISVEDYIAWAGDNQVDFKDILNDYVEECTRSRFFNFEDMIYFALRLLVKNKNIRNRVQSKYRYILVDEFQDINNSQLMMLKIIALPHNNLYVVGDDDQMIFGFRGAEVNHILNFEKSYPLMREESMQINYRSNRDIVEQSKWLIDNNQNRVDKEIEPFKEKRSFIQLEIKSSMVKQIVSIAYWIMKIKNQKECRYGDFAVLYRYNQYTDLMSIVLNKYGIPVKRNSKSVLSTEIGKCIFAYLTVIHKRNDSSANHYREILKTPNKYFSFKFIRKIECWDDFVDTETRMKELTEIQQKNFKNFVSKIKRFSMKGTNKHVNTLNEIIENFGIEKHFKDLSSFTQKDKLKNTEIIKIIKDISACFSTFNNFYDYWEKMINTSSNGSDEQIDEIGSKVILTTIHKTKGNQYKNVAYFNLNKAPLEGLTHEEVEEERRVTYVGLTRAEEEMLITSQSNDISPFVNEFCLNPEYKNIKTKDIEKKLEQYKTKRYNGKLTKDEKEETPYLEKEMTYRKKIKEGGGNIEIDK